MPESIEEQDQYEGLKISLQGELISAWLKDNNIDESTENKIRWINEYSKKYREIINANPRLIQEYFANPEKAVEKIKALLYAEAIN